MSDYVFNYYQYKNSIPKKNNFNFTIVFFVIIILLSLCVFLKPKPTKLVEFYFVEIDCFQTYQQAINLSNELTLFGGAGYIYFDGNYHVIASFHSSYDDAKSVCKNIKTEYKNSSIFTLSNSPFVEQKNLNISQNNSIKDFIKTAEKTILDMEKYLIMCSKKEIAFNALSIALNETKKDFDLSYNSLLSSFKTNSKLNTMKEYANQISKSISDLCNTSEQNFLAKFRYQIVNIVVNYHHFLSCFWFLFNSINCQIPSPIKNKAKNFFKIEFEMLFAINAPPKLNTLPTTAKSQVFLKSTNLFLMWIKSATTAIGKNATRLTPCALNCSYFKNMVKIGIVSVPPPIPMPATIPPITPATISQNIINHLPYQHSNATKQHKEDEDILNNFVV